MLEAYVGADAFRDSVRRYMRKHAYGELSVGVRKSEKVAMGHQ